MPIDRCETRGHPFADARPDGSLTPGARRSLDVCLDSKSPFIDALRQQNRVQARSAIDAHLINARSSRYIARLNATIPSVTRYARCPAIDGLMLPVVS